MKAAIAWLLGMRVVERDEQHLIIRLPRWLCDPESIDKFTTGLARDAGLVGKQLRVTHGDRLLRIDVVTVPEPGSVPTLPQMENER